MVKTILFVINHHQDLKAIQNICQDRKVIFSGTLFSMETEIVPGLSYSISPKETSFDYIVSLMDKFDEVIFLKNHDSIPILIDQLELERIYNNNLVDKINFKPLDKNKLIFFGCSHTAGIGHELKNTTYPFILSKMLDYEYINFGVDGSGNYQIEDRLSELSISGGKLIIQFSDIYRYRFILNSQVYPRPIAEKNIGEFKIYNIPHNYKDSKFVNEENLVYNFQNIVTRLVIRLRDSNNKFLITYTPHFENDSILQTLEFMYGFKEFVAITGRQCDTVSDGHYGPMTHKRWAEGLYQRWIELYGKE
jgi:hypothetical protein